MTVKKTTERSRQTKRPDRVSAIPNGESDREETPCTHENIYGVRYLKQEAAAGLAQALDLG